MDLNLSNIKSMYCIGIGGVGISSLAHFALSRGMTVSGLNDDPSPNTLDPLRAKGVAVMLEKPDTIPEADMYVYSDAWLYRGPEILEKARATGKPVLSYFEALGLFSEGYEVIAVAGVHGKTTTTAMIGGMLADAGLDPTVVVGSLVKKFGGNFRLGASKYLVVEADEYMRHFLNLTPSITVITNVEADHLDYYKDLADVESAFSSLVAKTKTVIVCDPTDDSVQRILSNKKVDVVDYTEYLEAVPKLAVPGVHNTFNAACALAVAHVLKIPEGQAGKSVAQFEGTWRRLEKKGMTTSGTLVYDDYAHHPTEARASLQALRELYPRGEKKITVLFQPHLYSRTKALFNDFVSAFDDADNVFLLPIYFAREDPDPTVSSELLADAIRMHRGEAVAFADFEKAEAWLRNMQLGSGDILLTMGAGEAYKIGDALL